MTVRVPDVVVHALRSSEFYAVLVGAGCYVAQAQGWLTEAQVNTYVIPLAGYAILRITGKVAKIAIPAPQTKETPSA
jgi:hypothetical protein